MLSKALAGGQLVGVQSGKESDYFGSHYLTIIKCEDGKVWIKNPWANDMKYYPEFPAKQSFLFQGAPKGPGFKMVDGEFECSIQDLKAYFGRITVQKSDMTKSLEQGNAKSGTTDGADSQGTADAKTSSAANDKTSAALTRAETTNPDQNSAMKNSEQGAGSAGVANLRNKQETMSDDMIVANRGTDLVSSNSDSAGKILLKSGSALVAQDRQVVLDAGDDLSIQLDPRSTSFAVKLGDSVVVYNLGNEADGKVKVLAGGGYSATVQPGHAVLK